VFGHTHAGALKGSHMSVPMLKKMIQQKKLDPNDPRNRHLLELLSSNKEQDGEGFVRFDSLADMLRLGGDNKDDFIKIKDNSSQVVGHRWMGEQHLTIPATIRHKLLMSRQQNPALFAGSITWNPVPLLENEIGDDDLLNKVYAVEFPDAEDYGGACTFTHCCDAMCDGHAGCVPVWGYGIVSCFEGVSMVCGDSVDDACCKQG
jgi:hypothetical protein